MDKSALNGIFFKSRGYIIKTGCQNYIPVNHIKLLNMIKIYTFTSA